MRRIGTELGVDPTAVYRHFRNKDELLTCLAERIFSTEPRDRADAVLAGPAASARAARVRALPRASGPRHAARRASPMTCSRRWCGIREQTLEALDRWRRPDTWSRRPGFSHMFENHVVGCGLFFAVVEHCGDARLGEPAALRRAFARAAGRRVPAFSRGGAVPVRRPRRDVRPHHRVVDRSRRARRVAPTRRTYGCSAAR